jgi:hypothetical protein
VALTVVGVVQHGRGVVQALSGLPGEVTALAEAEVPAMVAVEVGRATSLEAARTTRRRLQTLRLAVAEQEGLTEAAGASREAVGEFGAVGALLWVLEVVLPGKVVQCTCTDHNPHHHIDPE